MLKLYGGARSRASIVQWYLEELGVPYEFVMLDMKVGEHRQPDFLSINPMGKVPAIVDGTVTLWESGAILLYLADAYGETPLSAANRAQLAQWVLFANATLGPEVFAEATRDRAMTQLVKPLSDRLSQQPYLLGDSLTVADIAVGSLLAYIPLMLKIGFEDYPGVNEYLQRIYARPGFQKSIGARSSG